MFTDFGARLPRLVALLEAWTMVFQLIRWVDLHRSLSTRRILKNMMLLRILFASEFQGPGRQAGRSAGFHNHVRDPRVIRKVTGLGGERTASFSIIGHQMRNWE